MASSSGSDTPSRRMSSAASTPSRHRKSHSTSAIAGLVSARKPTSSGLAAVAEGRKSSNESDTPLDPRDALEDVRSLRSSGRRRLRALRDLERGLASACGNGGLEAFVALQVHTPLLTLLARHAASLSKRASITSLPAGDEFARHLSPEIDTSLSILQGVTLLSRNCKAAVGERWAMEMFLDLLLLLRTQTTEGNARPTAYNLLDLLFCVLVDSPEHARTFEDLQGLEAVTRVLRGTDVPKDVKMKCCEFLYFWLLPEGAITMPDMGANLPELPSRSTSTSSMGNSFLVGEASSASFATTDDITMPSPAHSRTASEVSLRASTREGETGLPFVPQTPRKPAKPSLGFQTPSRSAATPSSMRRISGSSTATTLTPVPSSPDDRKEEDDGSLTRRDSKAWAAAQRTGLVPGREDAGSRASSGSSTSSSATVVPPGHKRRGSVGPSPPSRVTVEQTARVTRSSTSTEAGSLGASLARRPSMRAGSITKSPLSGDTVDSPAAVTPVRPRPSHSRTQSSQSGLPSTTPEARGQQKSRGFPSELTRGMLPSVVSSPVPLTPSRRIPTERLAAGSIRSVAEKKEMLGKWLGNVDQLVQGVEKVGLWPKK
ncbi:uncharacterized protein EHS24_009699 [Apiotrichum porosum]|uniref:Cell division control protein 14 n=1 Tax=Apiotrichum porosum TaxID=105984 RepID=A0A427XMT4_9TREE|nr:uncharacterized protein EHS24_009699 [Apiotrichum porosum]RSH80027.1 hypothetical protein EHS24_009699 [Apiotrichum porosum]